MKNCVPKPETLAMSLIQYQVKELTQYDLQKNHSNVIEIQQH